MLSNSLKSRLKSSLIVLFWLTGLSLNAQQSGIDFSANFHVFGSFNGANFSIDSDPLDATNPVGKIKNNGDIWEGIYLDLPNGILLDSQKMVSIRFYNFATSPQAVLLKLEDNNNTDVEMVVSASVSGWSTLDFDFSQAFIAGSTTPVNASGTYTKMVLFVNGGSSDTGTHLIDDITYPNYESSNSLDVVYTSLVYADEFSYFGPVNTADWFSEVVPPNSWGWFNGEKQHYTDRTDNAYLSNGSLKIVAKKETYTDYGLTLNYTSTRLNSNFNFTYGRIDVRAKLPQGDGTWPAIWMLGTSIGNNWHPATISWPGCGEIDIMEHWGNVPNVVHGSTHTISSNGATVNTSQVKREGVFNEWHVYSVNWSPNQISFLMDGFLYYTYKPTVKNASTWPFDDPQFIVLNVAMGGIYPIDPNFVESQMEIDYIRVYQNVTNIEEKDTSIEINVYPNPASEFMVINAAEEGVFHLYDISGKEVMTSALRKSREQKISVSEWKAGIYSWQFIIGNRTEKGKLIITNR
ncbi:MAG: beta-glucanase (GH16 family) [Dokdonia sp.]|jgi:beta-glucanase (GH16 family)